MAPTITYKGVGEALFMRRDVLGPEIFAVTGNGYDLHVLATASGPLGEILEHRNLVSGDVVRSAGLGELERRLAANELPLQTDEGYIEILYTSDDVDDLINRFGTSKKCAWQVPNRRGLECDATPLGQERSTTEALCRACALPDERIVCVHLRHPTNHPVRTFGGFERLAGTALCEIGNDAQDGNGCRPGGKECWQRVVDLDATRGASSSGNEPAAADDLLRETAAAIDHFAAAYHRRYKARVWGFDQARTIAELGGTAHDEASFQRKVQVLGVLLDQIRPHAQLDEAQRLDGAGNRVGGLVALERLLGRDAPDAVEAVRTLRNIRTLRNDFPAHARARGFDDAVAALGIKYPPSDWNAAWRALLTPFRDSLNKIRAALAAYDGDVRSQ